MTATIADLAKLLPCICGRKPELITGQAAEDAMAIWAQCRCGRCAEPVEDAYIFQGMADDAIAAWNREHGQRLN